MASQGLGLHVLVVDDDLICVHAIKQTLQAAGYQVSVAHHFSAALDCLEHIPPPDLLITDIVMPSSINGVALARMARIRHSTIRVIYTTGYAVPGIEREMLGPLMRKPLDGEQLLKTIEEELHQIGL